MNRILFLVLCSIPAFQVPAHAAIEIYSNGHRYESIQAYQDSKKPVGAPSSSSSDTLSLQQEEYIRKKAQQLGINVDFSKVRTFQIDPKNITPATRHKLYVMSVENGVVGALHDFYQNWGQSDFQLNRRISIQQLQEVIQQAVTRSKEPKLLISQPGKVRIMALTVDVSEQ